MVYIININLINTRYYSLLKLFFIQHLVIRPSQLQLHCIRQWFFDCYRCHCYHCHYHHTIVIVICIVRSMLEMQTYTRQTLHSSQEQNSIHYLIIYINCHFCHHCCCYHFCYCRFHYYRIFCYQFGLSMFIWIVIVDVLAIVELLLSHLFA